MAALDAVPGMIEQAEWDLLVDAALGADLSGGATAVEFGAYFGRSTRALWTGLLDNEGFDPAADAPLLHTYDLFACAEAGVFAQHVNKNAQEAGLTHLLDRADGRLGWSRVFDHFAAQLPHSQRLVRHAGPLGEARHAGGPIALMHIDAPKFYEEYLQVLRHFGPALKPGAHLLFQDFFYHWSATLIAAVMLLVREGWFEPAETAASTLMVRLARPLAAADIEAVHARYLASDGDALLAEAIEFFSGFEMDRREQFLSRLYLAAVQFNHERGRHPRAGNWLKRLYFEDRMFNDQSAYDLCELVKVNFSVRRFYDIDTLGGSASA